MIQRSWKEIARHAAMRFLPPCFLLCGYYSVRQSIVIASRRDLAIIAAWSIFCLRGESLNVTFITTAIMNQNGEIKVEAAFLDSLWEDKCPQKALTSILVREPGRPWRLLCTVAVQSWRVFPVFLQQRGDFHPSWHFNGWYSPTSTTPPTPPLESQSNQTCTRSTEVTSAFLEIHLCMDYFYPLPP